MLDTISTRLDTARQGLVDLLKVDSRVVGYQILPGQVQWFSPPSVTYTVLLLTEEGVSIKKLAIGAWQLVKGPELLGQITHKTTPLGLGQVWRSEMASPVNQWTITVRRGLGNGTSK